MRRLANEEGRAQRTAAGLPPCQASDESGDKIVESNGLAAGQIQCCAHGTRR